MLASEEDPVVGVGKALPVPPPVAPEVVGVGEALPVPLPVAPEAVDVGLEVAPLIVLLVAILLNVPLPPGGGGGTAVPLLDPVVLFPAPDV